MKQWELNLFTSYRSDMGGEIDDHIWSSTFRTIVPDFTKGLKNFGDSLQKDMIFIARFVFIGLGDITIYG